MMVPEPHFEKPIDEPRCPRCGRLNVKIAEPETVHEPAVHDFDCQDCHYVWNWREGSPVPKPDRATVREAAADAEAELALEGSKPEPEGEGAPA